MNAQANATVEADQTRMLRDSAIALVSRLKNPKELRAWRGKLPGHDPAITDKYIDAGWLGLLVPEDRGGFGGQFADMAAVCEELGKGLLAEALLAHGVLAARLLVHCGSNSATDRLIAGLIAGTTRPAVAWQCGDGAWAGASAGGVRIESTGQKKALTGALRFVSGGGDATGFIVAANTGSASQFFWVPADAPGLSVSHEWRIDGTPSSSLAFGGVLVTDEDQLAHGNAAALALARAIDEAAVMASAELLGVMSAALDLSLGYMRTRVQFGKPIGSFQTLAHRAVDQYVQQQLAADSLRAAVVVLDAQPSDAACRVAADRTKSRCGDAALKLTRESIQIHGAIGFTDEYDAGLYLKRAVVLAAWLGNSSQRKRRYGSTRYASISSVPANHESK